MCERAEERMVRCKDTGRGCRAQDGLAGDEAVSSRVVGGGGREGRDSPSSLSLSAVLFTWNSIY